MNDGASMTSMARFLMRSGSPSVCPAADSRPTRAGRPQSCWLRHRRPVLRQALEIEDPADQVRLLLYPPAATSTESSQPMPVLGFSKQFLDQLPTPLRELIAHPAHPHPHPRMRRGAAAPLAGDVAPNASVA